MYHQQSHGHRNTLDKKRCLHVVQHLKYDRIRNLLGYQSFLQHQIQVLLLVRHTRYYPLQYRQRENRDRRNLHRFPEGQQGIQLYRHSCQ